MAKYVLALLVCVLLVGCGGSNSGFRDPSTTTPSISISALQAAPEQITLDGQQYAISVPMTFMARVMYMGSGAPDGDPLYGEIHVICTDPQAGNQVLAPNRLWVINGDRVWETNMVYGLATGGPKWGPGAYVDVVVRVTDAHGVSHLLKATHLLIGSIG